MAEPEEKVRYDIGNRVQFLEFLSVPNLFLDGDFNTNTSLIWQFLAEFFDTTFGPIRTDGFGVSLIGQDITISAGTLWYKYFYIKESTNATLNNERILGTDQYIYLEINHRRITIADDPIGTSPITIRANINGSDHSRPNQYIYDGEFIVSDDPALVNTTGNIPDNGVGNPELGDTYYIRLAHIDPSDVITNELPLFNTVASETQIDDLQSQVNALAVTVAANTAEIANVQEQVDDNRTDIDALQSADNAKLTSAANSFTRTQTYNLTNTEDFNFTSGKLILTTTKTGNFFEFPNGSNITLNEIATLGTGTPISLKQVGTGTITLTHNVSKLVLPAGTDIVMNDGDWVDFKETGLGIWEATNVSWNLIRRMLLVEAAIAGIVTPTSVPVGGIIDYGLPLATYPTPEGFQLCNGSTIVDPRSILIGGITPNLNGRVTVGADSDELAVGENLSYSLTQIGPGGLAPSGDEAFTNYYVSKWGEKISLNEPATPPHTHEVLICDDYEDSVMRSPKNNGIYGNNDSPIIYTNQGRSGQNLIKTMGNGLPVENRQPYYAVYKMMRIF